MENKSQVTNQDPDYIPPWKDQTLKQKFETLRLYVCLSCIGLLFLMMWIFIFHNDYIESEGKDLIDNIITSEQAYFAKHDTFYNIGANPVTFDPVLDIDARSNKYFKYFIVTAASDSFHVEFTGEKDMYHAKHNTYIADGNKDSVHKFRQFMDEVFDTYH